MNARRICVFASIALSWATTTTAQAPGADIPSVSRHLMEEGACPLTPAISSPLTLDQAIELTLCASPEYRAAWSNARSRAAEIGVSRAALLPLITGTGSYDWYRRAGTAELELFNTDMKYWFPSFDATLEIPVYDFGWRLAKLRQARNLFFAGQANAEKTLLDMVLAAANAFFEALNAQITLENARVVENGAAETLATVSGRARGGAAGITEELRARTALLQAQTRRMAAEADDRAQRGALAIRMGIRASTQFSLLADEGYPTASYVPVPCAADTPMEDLLKAAVRSSPRLALARAELAAAEEGVAVAKASGLPYISLRGRYQGFDQHFIGSRNAYGISQVPSDNTLRTLSGGIRIEVPVFDGLARISRIRSARATADSKRAAVAIVEEEVMRDLWRNYQQFQSTCCESPPAIRQMLDTSSQLFAASRERYRAGVGDVLEPIDAQRALSEAHETLIRNRSTCTSAALHLSADLGRMGF